MNNFDPEFEKLREKFEKGLISVFKLTQEEIERLTEYYKKEIESNERDIAETKNKIKHLKNKIDNLV